MSEALLRRLVEMADGPGYVLALDGVGLEDLPERLATPIASYSIHRPATELALRRLILQARGAPFIALLPENLAQRLPPDLVRRAANAKVVALELPEVVSTLLEVPLTGTENPEVLHLALGHIESLRQLLEQRTRPTVIDRELLDELLLEACLDSSFRRTAPGTLLATWVLEPPHAEPGVIELIRRNLPILHGIEGSVLAWALGGADRLRAIVVRGALLDIEGEHPPAVWGPLHRQNQDPALQMGEEVFRGAVVRLARAAIEALGGRGHALIVEAETVGRQLLSPVVLAQSTLLPLGLENRCQDVARRAVRGPVPVAEINWLRRHRAAPRKEATIDLLEELARLSRYLAEPGVEASAGVAERVRAWQRSGAFADRAAERARRALAATGEFHDQADEILRAYLTRRDEENRAFAEALAGGYVEALHREDVVPLQRLWTQVVKPAAGKGWSLERQGGAGGLFLVVLDGCSYPLFLELLEDLGSDPGGPLGLAPEKDEVIGLPGLAPLPTITSHARGAIFLGRIPQDPWLSETLWREEKERSSDPARFKQNKALGKLTRRLFLKGDLADSGRGLLEALDDPALDVVAAVFNAVDDQIGSSNTGGRIRVRPQEIAGFVPALRRALDAKRRILLVADHGHSPFWGKARRVGAGSTPRHLSLSGEQAAPEGFLEIEVEKLGGSSGRQAFAWKVGAYLGMPQVGFHGGCGLEEMVVPMAWIRAEGLPADEPAWWNGTDAGRQAPAAPAPALADEEQARRPTVAPDEPLQLDLLAGGGAATKRAGRKGEDAIFALAAAIEGLAFPPDAIEDLDPYEKAALAVLSQNGMATATELAHALGRLPGRMTGFMAKLRRKLHEARVEAFRIEEAPDGELRYCYTWRGQR